MSGSNGTQRDQSPPSAASGDALGPLLEAEQVLEALNDAIDMESPPAEKVRHLLRRFQELLGDDPDIELLLERDIERPQGPIIIERITVGPTFDRIEPRPHSVVQAVVEESEPILRMVMPYVLKNRRTPSTLDAREDVGDEEWFSQLKERYLEPHGWVNFLVGSWAASNDRMVMLVLVQREDQPAWGEDARRLLQLMLRAVAPLVDREMFNDEAAPAVAAESDPNAILEGKDLSGRQTDVLHLLLRGMSEKEVARELGVSTHTVHTHVKKLYTQFGVSSRGELLAQFVDQRVLKLTG